MGGPGSGPRKGGGSASAPKTQKQKITGAKTATQIAKAQGISKTRAKVISAKNEQMRKAAVRKVTRKQKAGK